MSLNPQQSLDELEQRYKDFLRSPKTARADELTQLRRTVARAEIELGNLARIEDSDWQLRVLYGRLLTTVELVKGDLPPE